MVKDFKFILNLSLNKHLQTFLIYSGEQIQQYISSMNRNKIKTNNTKLLEEITFFTFILAARSYKYLPTK